MVINILRIIILDELIEFFDFWYLHFPKNLIRNYSDRFYSLDKVLGFRSNLRNISKPLFQDYTLIGYILAFIYRILIIVFSSIIYSLLFIVYVIFLLIWLILPFSLIIYGVLFSK